MCRDGFGHLCSAFKKLSEDATNKGRPFVGFTRRGDTSLHESDNFMGIARNYLSFLKSGLTSGFLPDVARQDKRDKRASTKERRTFIIGVTINQHRFTICK